MAKPGEVLDAPSLGVQIEFRSTPEESGGSLLEFDVIGRPKGFITTAHVHPGQSDVTGFFFSACWQACPEIRPARKVADGSEPVERGNGGVDPVVDRLAHVRCERGEVFARFIRSCSW